MTTAKRKRKEFASNDDTIQEPYEGLNSDIDIQQPTTAGNAINKLLELSDDDLSEGNFTLKLYFDNIVQILFTYSSFFIS